MFKIFIILIVSIFLQSCSSLGYYWEKIQGHAEIVNNQVPVQDVIDNPETSSIVRERLINVQAARDFATKVLQLPDNESYRNYVDIGRENAVWTVVATQPYSIKPKEWCFFIVGCLSYRGYFSKQKADEFAEELKKQNMDVYVSGTKAYSTLGWFNDPLLSSMLYKSEAYRVGIIFHELAHQKIYVEDDTASNEAFASTVELEGVKTWFNQAEKKHMYKDYLISRQRDEDFKNLLKQTRRQLNTLYNNESKKVDVEKQKVKVFELLQVAYKEFKHRWDNYSGYDKWMSNKLNNAHLALISTYNDRIPAFQALFKKANYDYKSFYEKVEQLMSIEKNKRIIELDNLMRKI